MNFSLTTLWPAILGAIPIFGVTWAIYAFIVTRSSLKKGITVQVISVITLLNRAAKADGKGLRVLLGEDCVGNFAVVLLRVANTGGSPILAADFESPLSISFKNVKKVYFSAVKSAVPSNLRPVNTSNGNTVQIAPMLLNPRDSFIVEAGIDLGDKEEDLEIVAEARVVGVSSIRTLSKADAPSEKTKKMSDLEKLQYIAFFFIALSASQAIPKIGNTIVRLFDVLLSHN